jgi:hypothetical protein
MRCVIGIGVALAISAAGGIFAANASRGSETVGINLAEGPVFSMRNDGCPYYPSPVACRSDTATQATSER